MTPVIPNGPAPPRARSRGPLWFVMGVVLGLAVGFGLGVLSVKKARDVIAGMLRTERSADVSQTQDIDRPAFHLSYPGNWHVDTKDSDYDPDRLFSIDSPGQSFVMFSVTDAVLTPKKALDAAATAMTSKVMRDATRTPFTRWGTFEGEGVLLAGKNLGITPGTVRIFSFEAGGLTYTVTESTFDEDEAMVSPGFALIERTFKVPVTETGTKL